jgi:hypothetical protein
VSIFRRGKKSGPNDEIADPAVDELAMESDSEDTTEDTLEATLQDTLDDADTQTGARTDEAGGDDASSVVASGEPALDRSAGPFDAADVDPDDGRLDLGSLRIHGVAGMELRLEVDEQAGQVVGATAVMGDSAVQLQAFAAPRTAGIWDGIRSEIAESVVAQGGTADEAWGEFGKELRTRMPSAGPDGRTVFAPARFAGIDGPRWFLRAVFSGRAAIDDEAAAPLVHVVRNTVVVRGDAAMAPREMLPLTLPEQPQADDADAAADATPHADDLKPFERGPEITEVR